MTADRHSPASEPPRVEGATRRMAVTIDDLPVVSVARSDLEAGWSTTRGLVDALAAHHIPAVGFVNDSKLMRDGERCEEQIGLLRAWLSAGLELGNHTFSHLDLHRVSVEAYQRDILLGDPLTRELLERHGRTLTYFRHPYLNTGRSVEVRHGVDGFLSRHGYRVAPVTIYLEDYVFAAAYDWALMLGNGPRAERVKRTYLAYVEANLAYYETLSSRLFGREIDQILLLHANALNAGLLPELASMIERRGYAYVTLDEALRDPAYGSDDSYTEAGISWLQRWALTRGLPASFLDGEPETPRFVHRHARSPLRLALLRRVVRFREALRLRVKRPLARRLRRLLSRAASGATSRARSG